MATWFLNPDVPAPSRASDCCQPALLQGLAHFPVWLRSGLESRAEGGGQPHLKPAPVNRGTTQTVGDFTQHNGTWVGKGSGKDGWNRGASGWVGGATKGVSLKRANPSSFSENALRAISSPVPQSDLCRVFSGWPPRVTDHGAQQG